MDNNFNKKEDRDLLVMFKKQLKVQLTINLVITLIGAVIILLNLKKLFVVIITIVTVVIYWLYTSVKLIYLKKAINKLIKENDLTTLTTKEKVSAIEAEVEERNNSTNLDN